MNYPSYYDKVDPIRLRDPLAQFLGALEGGELAITYLDCVKLAGHSCPTVAGAYLMTRLGLDMLYPADDLPERSKIKVELSAKEDEGVAGVTGNVVGYITGAGGIGGFKGIGGNFARNELITYGVELDGDIRLTRLDNNKSVTLSYDPSNVPGNSQMKPLMQTLLRSAGSDDDAVNFSNMWQKRTETILLETDINQIIDIKKDTK